jgi:CheY-like chemotaxis protein
MTATHRFVATAMLSMFLLTLHASPRIPAQAAEKTVEGNIRVNVGVKFQEFLRNPLTLLLIYPESSSAMYSECCMAFGTVPCFYAIEMSTRILLVDDNDIIRYGVRTLLSKNGRWSICGEAADGEEAIMRVKELAPDVVILDLTMPLMNGFLVAEEIKRISPGTKVVFLSIHDTPTAARMAGADAFVHKGSAVRDLPNTLEQLEHEPSQSAASGW